MPANGRGFALKVQTTDSATENIPPGGFVRRVRVKRCGKSAPRPEQSGWQGKPHVEQDQIGEEERPAPLPLPGRSLEPSSNGRSRRMTAAPQGETETGLSSKGQLSPARQRPATKVVYSSVMSRTHASLLSLLFCLPAAPALAQTTI